jgi:hypothetical protein
MGLRDIKAKARADLHQAMRVGAFYYTDANATPIPCNVRVHTKFAALGDQKGTSFSYAETREMVPRLIFWKSEIDPDNRGMVMIAADEGYLIDHVDPPDGLTVTAQVSNLDAATRALLSYPGA